MEDPLLFAGAVLAILVMPGPTNTLVATGAATDGWRRALRLLPAEGTGYLLAILVIRLVLGPALAAAPALGLTLRVLIGIYLLWLSGRLWAQGAPQAVGAIGAVTAGRVFVTTLLNPKALIFALGIIPFEAAHVWRYLASFVGLVALAGFGWIGIGRAVGRAATAMRGAGLAPRLGAAAVAVFAVSLMLSPLLR